MSAEIHFRMIYHKRKNFILSAKVKGRTIHVERGQSYIRLIRRKSSGVISERCPILLLWGLKMGVIVSLPFIENAVGP